MSDTGALQSQPVRPPSGKPVFPNILCAVDGTRKSFAAVEQAGILAGPEGHLTLLAVTAVTGSGAYRTAAISPARVEQVLERATQIAERLEVPSDAVVDPGAPAARVILERAREHDLLALGAPAASWLGSKLADGVTAAALKELAVPMLACRRLPPGEHSFAERILLASDCLEGSDELVGLTRRLAAAHGSSVVLLHATDVESSTRPPRISEQVDALGDALKDAADVRIELDSPAEAIVQAADETDASLIVMGSRRHKGLRAIGSVSRRVVREAHCSVLLVAPAET